MTPSDLSAISAELAQAQTNLNRLLSVKQRTSAIYATALSQRPAGIPSSWLPEFTVSADVASVKAWFDPDFYGTNLTRR